MKSLIHPRPRRSNRKLKVETLEELKMSSSLVRYCIRSSGNWRSVASDEQPIQFVELRLGNLSRLISGSVPHEIFEQTPSTLIAEALFPFSVRNVQHSLYLVHFLCSFNLPHAVSQSITRKITSFALHLAAAAGYLNVNFYIIAAVDFVHIFSMIVHPIPPADHEETLLLEESVEAAAAPAATMGGAPESAMERVKNEMTLGEEELGDDSICCVCLEEVKGVKNVSKIPCGHVYHQSCILTWLHTNNSCPLCRRPLQQ